MCGASLGSGCVKFITCTVYGGVEVVGKRNGITKQPFDWA